MPSNRQKGQDVCVVSCFSSADTLNSGSARTSVVARIIDQRIVPLKWIEDGCGYIMTNSPYTPYSIHAAGLSPAYAKSTPRGPSMEQLVLLNLGSNYCRIGIKKYRIEGYKSWSVGALIAAHAKSPPKECDSVYFWVQISRNVQHLGHCPLQ